MPFNDGHQDWRGLTLRGFLPRFLLTRELERGLEAEALAALRVARPARDAASVVQRFVGEHLTELERDAD